MMNWFRSAVELTDRIRSVVKLSDRISAAENVESLTARADTLIAGIGLFASILLLPIPFLTTELFVTLVPLFVGGGSLAYLVIWKYEDRTSFLTEFALGTVSARVLETLAITSLGVLALLAALHGQRTIHFHALSGALGSIILFQILFVDADALRSRVVLAEIIGLVMSIQFTAILTTPGFIGVDIWTHVTTYAAAIEAGESLAAISESKYVAAPLYHLLVVSAAKAFGSSLRTGVFATVALVMSFSALLVYHTTRYLVGERWSLLATALFAMSDYVLRWSIDVIPTSLGLVFYLAILFALTKLYYTRDRLPVYGLALFFGLAVVLTHQVSAFIVLTLLGAGVVARVLAEQTIISRTVGRSPPGASTVNTIGLFVGTAAIAVGNWLITPYGSGSFLTRMLTLVSVTFGSAGFLNLRGADPRPLPLNDTLLTTTPLFVEVLDSIGFFLLFFVTVLGVLVLLQIDRLNQFSVSLVVAIAIMAVFTLGLPLFGVNVFLPGRWYAFMYALMAVVGVLGVRFVTRRTGSRAVVVGMVVFVLVFPGSMVVAHKATPERPVFDDVHPQMAYSHSELAAAESITSFQPAGEDIVTDHPYRTVFSRWLGQNATMIHYNRETGDRRERNIVYRRYQTSGTPVVRVGQEAIRVQVPYQNVCHPSYGVVYSNGVVHYCRNIAP